MEPRSVHVLDNSRLSWGTLVAMPVLAVLYYASLIEFHTITGEQKLDGGIGVILGLFIAAQPASNAIAMFFYERGRLRRISREWSGIAWLGLNVLVLLVGWFVIVVGTSQFIDWTGLNA